MMMNSFLAIGTQGVTTAIAASIPLALNRFLLTYQSRFYKFFFGSGSRIVLTLVCYNFLVFLTFYTLYELSIIGLLIGGNLIPSTTYYIVTITIVVVANVISLILMLFVLYHIYSSFTLVISLDQTKMLKERKRIAWVIIFQILINFGLSISRVAAFYNVSFNFDKRPALACYRTLLNIYDSFSYVYQELLVCIDCIVYLFILTPYREELAKFLKKRLGCNRVHAIMVSTVPNSFNPQIVVHPRGHSHIT
uniref:Uncharacterized protein n=1 Tax=Acrobeloides nanus TaxID=290746 RepID=A0A914ECP0_9BILA